MCFSFISCWNLFVSISIHTCISFQHEEKKTEQLRHERNVIHCRLSNNTTVAWHKSHTIFFYHNSILVVAAAFWWLFSASFVFSISLHDVCYFRFFCWVFWNAVTQKLTWINVSVDDEKSIFLASLRRTCIYVPVPWCLMYILCSMRRGTCSSRLIKVCNVYTNNSTEKVNKKKSFTEKKHQSDGPTMTWWFSWRSSLVCWFCVVFSFLKLHTLLFESVTSNVR